MSKNFEMSFAADVSTYFSLVHVKDLEEEVQKQTSVVYARKFPFMPRGIN